LQTKISIMLRRIIQKIYFADFSSRNKAHLFWALQIVGWTGYLFIFSFFVTPKRPQSSFEFFQISITYITGLLISLLLWRINKYLRKKNIPLLLLSIYILIFSFLLGFLWMAFDWALSYPFWTPESIKEKTQILSSFGWTFGWTLSYFLKLLPWSLLYFLINFWINWNEQKIATARNQQLYNEARLLMLRYQLNPHFFFNALNSIDALIDEDRFLAKEMIYKLSDFLRYSFLSEKESLVKLEDELVIIEKYFDIEKIRFEDKIKINYNIDADTRELKVPGFILHPIVENAIKHGMKSSSLPLSITISTKKFEDGLSVIVTNSGSWIGEKFDIQKIMSAEGIGLKNVYNRLDNSMGKNFSFNIYAENEVVEVEIILRHITQD